MNCENICIKNIIELFFNISTKIILNIAIKLYNTLGNIIKSEIVTNTIKNLSNLIFNQIQIHLNNEAKIIGLDQIIEKFNQIQKILDKDLITIVKISQNITLNIIKNMEGTQYNFESEYFFSQSIQNQIKLIITGKYDYFLSLITN